MNLTEMDDVGGVIIASLAVMVAIFALAVYSEERLLAPARPPDATGERRTGSGRTRPRLPTRRRDVWGAAALGVASVLLFLAVISGDTLHFDADLLPTFTAVGDTTIRHVVARVVVMGGQMWLVGPALAAAAAWNAWRHRTSRPLWVAGAGLAAMTALLWVMKVTSARSAPHSGVNRVLDDGMSYPSGHIAAAMYCLPLLLALVAGTLRTWPVRTAALAGFGAAAAVGLSTVVLGYHWPTDAVGGWLLGAALAWPALELVHRPNASSGPTRELHGHAAGSSSTSSRGGPAPEPHHH